MDRLKMTDYEIFLLLSKYLETNDNLTVRDAIDSTIYIHKCEYKYNHLNILVSYKDDPYINMRNFDINEYSKIFRSNLINKLKCLNLDTIDYWND